MPARLPVHCIAAYLIFLFASYQQAAGQSPSQTSVNLLPVYVDEIGFEYTLVDRNGLTERAYQRPVERAIAWEVRSHLHKIGLPDVRGTNRPTHGVDGLGRSFRYDVVGYPYYEVLDCGGPGRVYYQPRSQSVATHVQEVLECVDWEAAVREASRNTVIRGFGQAAEAVEESRQSVRTAVRDAVADSLNFAGATSDGVKLETFQELIAAGIEDALVEAFNQAAALEVPAPGGDTLGLPLFPRAKTDRQSHATLGRPPEPLSRDAANEIWITTHLGRHIEPSEFERNYKDATLITAGWIVAEWGVKPISAKGGALMLTRSDSPFVEIWRDGRLLCDGCRFARYFEDAQRLAITQPVASAKHD
ncbi:MAG: hypothetical protein ABI614_07625 [Planctomycetota bacterium]